MNSEERYQSDPLFKAANDIYSLYFIGWLIGFLAFFIGGVWARRQVSRANDMTASHFQFQYAMAIQAGLVLAVLMIFMLLTHWLRFSLPWGVMPLSVVIYIWWWLWRNIAGYRILMQQQTIANPKTWGKPCRQFTQENK